MSLCGWASSYTIAHTLIARSYECLHRIFWMIIVYLVCAYVFQLLSKRRQPEYITPCDIQASSLYQATSFHSLGVLSHYMRYNLSNSHLDVVSHIHFDVAASLQRHIHLSMRLKGARLPTPILIEYACYRVRRNNETFNKLQKVSHTHLLVCIDFEMMLCSLQHHMFNIVSRVEHFNGISM